MAEAIKKATKIGWRKIVYGAAAMMMPIWTFMMWGKPTGFMSFAGVESGGQVILDPTVAKFGLLMILLSGVVVVGGNVIEMLSPGINAWLGARGKDS